MSEAIDESIANTPTLEAPAPEDSLIPGLPNQELGLIVVVSLLIFFNLMKMHFYNKANFGL
jgi:hypothetical protein